MKLYIATIVTFLFQFTYQAAAICSLKDLRSDLAYDYEKNNKLTCKLKYYQSDCGFLTSGQSLEYWLKALKEIHDIDDLYDADFKKVDDKSTILWN